MSHHEATLLEELKRVALAFVNEVREALPNKPTLAELPVGCKVNSMACPMAHALPGCDQVDGEFAYIEEAYGRILIDAGFDTYTSDDNITGCYVSSDQVALVLPENVRDFIVRFDGGDYPELIQ